MVNKILLRILASLFSFNAPKKMFYASLLGVLLGFLPLQGYKAIAILFFSIIFQLNVFSIIIGLLVSLIFVPGMLSISLNMLNNGPIVLFLKPYIDQYIGNDYSVLSTSYENGIILLSFIITIGVCLNFVYLIFSKLYDFLVKTKGYYTSNVEKPSKIGFGISFQVIILLLLVLSFFIKYTYQIVLIGVDTYISNPFNLMTFGDWLEQTENVLSKGFIDTLAYFSFPICVTFLSTTLFGIILKVKRHKNALPDSSKIEYVFHDPGMRRWSIIKKLMLIFVFIFILPILMFSLTLKELSFVFFSTPSVEINLQDVKPISTTVDALSYNFLAEQKNAVKKMAFFETSDPFSKISLEKNIDKLNVLFTDWFKLNKDSNIEFQSDTSVETLAKNHNVSIIPTLFTFPSNSPEYLAFNKILASNAERAKIENFIYNKVKEQSFEGVNINLANVNKEDKNQYHKFAAELYQIFHKYNLKIYITITIDNISDYSSVSKYCDFLITDLFNFTDNANIDDKSFYDNIFNTINKEKIPNEKLIIGIGTYAKSSNGNALNPTVLSYTDALELATKYNSQISFQNYSWNFSFKDESSVTNNVKFFDSVSVFNQIMALGKLKYSGISLWKLGSEENGTLDLLNGLSNNKFNIDNLKEVSTFKPAVKDISPGEIITGMSTGSMGCRTFNMINGLISGAKYTSLPISYEITRRSTGKDKDLALSFDDGPDPKFTPLILDILQKHQIKGTFFVIGQQATAYPDIIKNIYDQGHEIGNHTYNHINMDSTSQSKTMSEVNACNSIIELLTGHSSNLFREPYYVDSLPPSALGKQNLHNIVNSGYRIVGDNIDSRDWEAKDTDEIIKNVESGLPRGKIILFHDGGGDRSHTVEALEKLISYYKSKGYSFIPISQLLNEDRSSTMPVKGLKYLNINISQFVLYVVSNIKSFLFYLFFIGTIIGVLRFVFLVIFATKQKHKSKRRTFNPDFRIPVSIVIAAYNEEKVICHTISSLLESDYSHLEILIIDDGSKDNTFNIVKEKFKGNRKVRILKKENGGKAAAVNFGFKVAWGDIVVVIDADTIIANDAISLMARHFDDPKIAAVAGNVKVGNKKNLLTKWQHIEYVTGLNLDRRAFDELNCITVVPGAIGAWRRDIVINEGMYNEDTLAEDADITIKVIKKGYRIIYEEGAKAFTEAPDDVNGFLKQRVRWAYGTLQCLWKHNDALFNSKYKSLGFVALPNMWLYQVIFASFSPLTDILFVLGIFGSNPKATLITYLAFFTIDFIITLYAFSLEKESPRPLLLFFVQRIVYRQFMTYVVYKSIVSALKGEKVGWNKLNRTGGVTNGALPHLTVARNAAK